MCLPEMLAVWSSGCQCLLNVVIMFEPPRRLFHKAAPPLCQTLKLSTSRFYLCDIMVVYLDCFNDTFCQIPAAAWWLTGDFCDTTSDGSALNGESLNKHQTFTNNQLKLKRISFFSPLLFQNITLTYSFSSIIHLTSMLNLLLNLWALNFQWLWSNIW